MIEKHWEIDQATVFVSLIQHAFSFDHSDLNETYHDVIFIELQLTALGQAGLINGCCELYYAGLA